MYTPEAATIDPDLDRHHERLNRPRRDKPSPDRTPTMGRSVSQILTARGSTLRTVLAMAPTGLGASSTTVSQTRNRPGAVRVERHLNALVTQFSESRDRRADLTFTRHEEVHHLNMRPIDRIK